MMQRRALGPITVAVVVGLTTIGCASEEPATVDYVEEMTRICESTETTIAGLPRPPEQISARNFAIEVARTLDEEAAATDAIVVGGDAGPTHRNYVTTTRDLSAAWTTLSELLADPAAADPDEIESQRTEVTELSLGRDDLATELGLDACRRGEA